MSFNEELKNLPEDALVNSLESFFDRIAASGEDPDHLASRLSQEYPAFEGLHRHIHDDCVRMGMSPADAYKVAYGATLSHVAVIEEAKAGELRQAFEEPGAKEGPSASEAE